MKKITKAAIAGTVGAALLVGGAGSLAFWTDTATPVAVDIQSGQLDLGLVAAGTWTIQQNAPGVSPAQNVTPAPVFVPASDKIVPGDVLTTTVNVPVVLDGKNIKGKLEVNVQALVAGSTPVAAADTALIAALNAGGVKVTKIDGTAVAAGVTSANLSGPSLNRTVPVEISVTFPWGNDTTSTFNTAMLGKVKFQASYTLTQIPVTP
jgi:alternate signal-mediated exported protein